MQATLILLPLLAWLLLFLLTRLTRLSQGSEADWRVEFLTASLTWGLALTVITELLSSLRVLTLVGVTMAWLIICATLVGLTFVARRHVQDLQFRLRAISSPLTSRLFLFGVVLIVSLTGLTAVVAPPNNWDSFVYHVSRVMHWMQNRNVDFYATHVLHQLFQPPWTEYGILHLQILSGGDRFANLVQWFSMGGSLIGVTLIARELGANREGQLYAAVVCSTIPTGILDASNTKNDYAVGFWLVCLAYFGLRWARGGSSWHGPAAGASLGLALLTKGTAYLYGLPFLLVYGLAGLKARRFGAAKSLVWMVLIALLINANHYRRNVALFGLPLGPRVLGQKGLLNYTADKIEPRLIFLNAAKNVTLHLGTPFDQVNQAVERGVSGLASSLGLDVNDPAISYERARIPFQVRKTNTFEDTAGNPLHLGVTLTAFLLCVLDRRSWESRNRDRLLYMSAVCLGILVVVSYLKWQVWGSHYHVAMFVLASPLVGASLGSLRQKKAASTAMWALLVMSVPWLIANRTRPLISWSAFTPFPSILARSRSANYFNAAPSIEAPYRAAAALIADSGCPRVGVSFGSSDAAEYLLWVLFSENSASPRIEHVDFEWDRPNPSRKLATAFEPCAVFNVWYDSSLADKYAGWIGGEVHRFDNVYAIVPK